MAVKFVVILSVLVATAYGSFVPVVANQDSSSFSYDVADPYTGDYKSHSEVRDGDVVRGQYSLLDSDNTYRIVDYTADDLNGFNAVVRKEPVAAAAAAVVETPVVADAVVDASPVIAARTLAPAVAPVYHEAAPALVATNTIAPVVAARTYNTPLFASEAYASPAVIARNYAPSIYANAWPTISRGYASPSIVTANAYSSPLVYPEPSLVSSGYYGGSYISPYYSGYGVNGVPVDAFDYYKK